MGLEEGGRRGKEPSNEGKERTFLEASVCAWGREGRGRLLGSRKEERGGKKGGGRWKTKIPLGP